MKAMTYLTHAEEKRECLKSLNDMLVQLKSNTIEYRALNKQYFSLLMLDISRGNSLSDMEKAYIAKNIHLLDKYPKATREKLQTSLIDMGIMEKPEPEVEENLEDTKEKVKVEYKTYAELYPEQDTSRAVEKVVKKLKDSYVYLKPAIKMCDKLIEYIQTLKFRVSTPVTTKDDVMSR